jgi:hypothetical protein
MAQDKEAEGGRKAARVFVEAAKCFEPMIIVTESDEETIEVRGFLYVRSSDVFVRIGL